MKRVFWVLALAFACGLAGWSARAADHLNLDRGLPTQVEDAYPTAFRNREVQGTFRYDRTRDDKDRFELAPRLELGIAPNTQLSIDAPFYLGNAEKTGSGNVRAEALYNFNTEGIYLPAFAAAAEAEFPSGRDSRGVDTRAEFILTKSITRTGLDRIHFNAAWLHNAGARQMERENRYELVAGYSRRLGADIVGVADFIRQQEMRRGENSNVFEAGIRWQLTPLTILSLGAGFGVGEESPKAKGILGIQRSF